MENIGKKQDANHTFAEVLSKLEILKSASESIQELSTDPLRKLGFYEPILSNMEKKEELPKELPNLFAKIIADIERNLAEIESNIKLTSDIIE